MIMRVPRRGLAVMRRIGTVDLASSRPDNAVRIHRTAKKTISLRAKQSSLPSTWKEEEEEEEGC